MFDKATRHSNARQERVGPRKFSNSSVDDAQVWEYSTAASADARYATPWDAGHWDNTTHKTSWQASWTTDAWDNCPAQNQTHGRYTQPSDGVAQPWGETDWSNTENEPAAEWWSVHNRKKSFDCARVEETRSPSQVSTVSGVSSSSSSIGLAFPRSDLSTLRACLPNAAIHVGDLQWAVNQEPHSTALCSTQLSDGHVARTQCASDDGLPSAQHALQRHAELESQITKKAGQEAEALKLKRDALGSVGDMYLASQTTLSTGCISYSNVRAHTLPGAYSVTEMQTGPSSTLAVSPPPTLSGWFPSTSPFPLPPPHSPDLARTSCPDYHNVQVDAAARSSWYPAGFECATIDQPFTHMLRESIAGATGAEIEEILRAAQPNVYED